MEKKYLLIIWLVLNYADFITTHIALPLGYHENNPFYLMNPTIHNIIKLIFVPILLIVIYRRINVKIHYFIVILYATVVINNILHLLFTTP